MIIYLLNNYGLVECYIKYFIKWNNIKLKGLVYVVKGYIQEGIWYFRKI